MNTHSQRATILKTVVVALVLLMPAGIARAAGNGATVTVTGGGHYLLALNENTMLPGTLAFGAVQQADGTAHGHLRIDLDLMDAFGGGVASFRGRVTCVSVDGDNGRAWIGGVVTANRSTNAFFRDDPVAQVGDDIWFRVLDDGEGAAAVDRTTFAGFEGGAGIITSQQYCDEQPWPDDNARTHPLTSGQVQVRN